MFTNEVVTPQQLGNAGSVMLVRSNMGS